MNGFRRFLRWVRAGAWAVSGGLWWAKRRLRKSRSIVVLTFHRVLDEPEYSRTHSLPGILMRKATFEVLAAYVARRYEPVDISRAVPGQDSQKLRIALTFDDGWTDNDATAFPIAHANGIPMTVFVCPGLLGLDSPFWPERVAAAIRAARPTATDAEIERVIENMKRCAPEDREHAIGELAVRAAAPAEADTPDTTLSWEQIAEMDRAGVTFGSHTQTHQILTMAPERAVRLEIRESKAAVERALNKPCHLFAYPNGNHSSWIGGLLDGAGFRLAFTTQRGAWTASCDQLAIPRMHVYEDNVAGPTGRFSPAMFEYQVFWNAWRAMQARSRN